jgi:hypothetical protein
MWFFILKAEHTSQLSETIVLSKTYVKLHNEQLRDACHVGVEISETTMGWSRDLDEGGMHTKH